MNTSIRAIACVLAGLLLSTHAMAAPPSDYAKLSAEETYGYGLKWMQRGLFDRAIEAFQHVRNFHRDDPLSVKSQLALADIQFRKGEFEEARYAYEEFATYHPRHDAMDHVTYRIGLCIYKRAPKLAGRDQTTTRAAVNAWTGFENRYPDSDSIGEVRKYLSKSRDRLAAHELAVAQFYSKRKKWVAVEHRATALLRRFPDSKHSEEALALLAESLHELGQADRARDVRDRLASKWPESTRLKRVDRALSKDPGTPPDDDIFIRPYRISQPQQGPQQ